MGKSNDNEQDAIEFFNRYIGTLETEVVYGDGFLKWAYGSPLGRLTTEAVVKRALFSQWYGWRMDRRTSAKKIAPFIEEYGLDVGEFLKSPDSFKTFNEFFYRHLKPEARPIDGGEDSIVFPADGRHLGFADASQIDRVFVKGQSFDIPKLLGDAELGKKYEKGSLVLSRLCPVDYHRFHFPVAGLNGEPEQNPKLLNGMLYSVNPIALRRNLGIFWENKRYLTQIKTEHLGSVLFLEIGATCVGGVVHTHVPGQYAEKGAEKGYFQFGGSSVITLFEPGTVELAEDLLEQTACGYELYAKMGDVMGKRKG